jgi:hypothetical protein
MFVNVWHEGAYGDVSPTERGVDFMLDHGDSREMEGCVGWYLKEREVKITGELLEKRRKGNNAGPNATLGRQEPVHRD